MGTFGLGVLKQRKFYLTDIILKENLCSIRKADLYYRMSRAQCVTLESRIHNNKKKYLQM